MAAELDPNQLIVNGGFAGGLLFVIWRVGQAIVKSIDNLVTGQAAHRLEDSTHHTATNEKLDTLLDRKGRGTSESPTPIQGVPVTPAQGGYSHVYGRPKSEPGGHR